MPSQIGVSTRARGMLADTLTRAESRQLHCSAILLSRSKLSLSLKHNALELRYSFFRSLLRARTGDRSCRQEAANVYRTIPSTGLLQFVPGCFGVRKPVLSPQRRPLPDRSTRSHDGALLKGPRSHGRDLPATVRFEAATVTRTWFAHVSRSLSRTRRTELVEGG